MLKTNVSLQVLVPNKVLVADEVDGIEDDNKLIKKCEKLSKTRKLSKSQKLSKTRKSFKSQKSAKLEKKLLKSGNLSNFNTKKNEPNFLTPDTRTAFNYLRLAFTKASILQYFDPEYHM